MSKFNYCPPLVQMFSSTKSLKRIENFQKGALRFLLNKYVSTYEDLLDKANRSSMNLNRLHILCAEIYKTINNFNRLYERDFCVKKKQRSIREQYKLNLEILECNQVTFGSNSLRIFGPKV